MTETAQTKDTQSRGWVQRHPLSAFLLMSLSFSYALMVIPMLAEFDVIPGRSLPGRLGIDMEEAASLLLIIAIFGSALAITYLTEGVDGLRMLRSRMTRWRVGLRWWLAAAVVIPTGTVVLAVLFGDEASVPSASTLLSEAGALLFALVVINLLEEATWTGFLQTRLERRFNFFIAAAMAAVPFALVHLPLRVITREATTVGELVAAFVTLLILGLFVRTLFAAVGRGASNSILLAAATHTMFNRSNNTDGLAADILSGSNRQAAALLTTVILTVVVVVASRRRLRKSYRFELDELETLKLHNKG